MAIDPATSRRRFAPRADRGAARVFVGVPPGPRALARRAGAADRVGARPAERARRVVQVSCRGPWAPLAAGYRCAAPTSRSSAACGRRGPLLVVGGAGDRHCAGVGGNRESSGSPLFARFAQRAEREFTGMMADVDQLSVEASKAARATDRLPLARHARRPGARQCPDRGVRQGRPPRGRRATAERRDSCTRVVTALVKRYGCVHECPMPTTRCWRRSRASSSRLICGGRRTSSPRTAGRWSWPTRSRAADLERAGRLMMHSHASLRDLYEVSSPELDTLVELALEQPGCHRARLTVRRLRRVRDRAGGGRKVERVNVGETGYEIAAAHGRRRPSSPAPPAARRLWIMSGRHWSGPFDVDSRCCSSGSSPLSPRWRAEPPRGAGAHRAVGVVAGALRARQPERGADLRLATPSPTKTTRRWPIRPGAEQRLRRHRRCRGYIVTNAHVVERATRLEVELSRRPAGRGASILRRGRTIGAQIVASIETDLAVLKVEARPALPFGDSDAPGSSCSRSAAPGPGTSVTMGVVSAVAGS